MVTIPGSLRGQKQVADTLASDPVLSGLRAILENVSQTDAGYRRPSGSWGRPAAEDGAGWAVVDVETSGFHPGHARVISIAALALGDDGNVEQSLYTLLNPGVDPGPTHVHGLTAEMLEGQPRFADIVGDLIELLRGRTLVAHNVGFDYSFLTAEAEMVDAELPIDTAMCTVELTRRLELGTENLRLETLAAHWGITQLKPHDALDDAMVLAQILKPVLVRARERKVWLPVRPLSRREWPNGQVTHEELRPLKMLAARLPCPYANPGRFVVGRPLVQGMRVALAAEVDRTHEELVERIVHAGLSYADAVDAETSLIICNEAQPGQGKGYQARELGVPFVRDADFMLGLDAVVGGSTVEEFTDITPAGDQFALF
jgi:DNA polymerase-3 subunit epsilon